MKKLIVAEKPSVARDIARVLGVKSRGTGFLYSKYYVVTWAVGHLVSLQDPGEMCEAWKKWRMADLPMLPETIPLKVLPGTRDQFDIVAKLMNTPKIDSIICATDSAREGELIFRYIYQKAGCVKPVERLWISSMTDEAIRAGFETLRPSAAYDALYASARCRSEADWLVGMNASRAFSLRYDARLSIGRVQTPTLSLIVQRDREIERFRPESFWTVTASFGDYEGLWINPNPRPAPEESGKNARAADTRAYDKETAEAVRDQVLGRPAQVLSSTREKRSARPPQLFDLTSLQREANSKFGFSASRTLDLAQSLYEKHKLLTYPRTDSRYLPNDMKPKVAKVLSRLPEPYAKLIASDQMRAAPTAPGQYYDDSKISDHHAIVPTDKVSGLEKLSPDEKKLYDLVARRLIAMHYPDYVCDNATVITGAGDHRFRSTGTIVLNPGWRAVLPPEKQEKEVALPQLNVGDARTVEGATVKANKTRPPAALTDASILRLMENAGRNIEDETLREQMKSSGLGTPATRAATIERLIEVGYATRRGKSIVSTEKGRKLIDVVPVQISSAVTTGKWEKFLSEMAGVGEADAREVRIERFMSGIRKFSQFLVDAARNAPSDVQFEKEPYKSRTAPKKAPARRRKAAAK